MGTTVGTQMSKIQWTEKTWNPLAGCKEVSPGCTNCYAAVMAHRLAAMGQEKYQGTTHKLDNGKVVWTGKINLMGEDTLTEPLKRPKPTMYFVNSMSDLFHEDVPDDFILLVFAVMAYTPQHTYQILTKRAERAERWFKWMSNQDCYSPQEMIANEYCMEYSRPASKRFDWPLPNVWMGVSVEDQKRADERIPHLLNCPAAVRFLSCEPLLGPVNVSRSLSRLINEQATLHTFTEDAVAAYGATPPEGRAVTLIVNGMVNWVIVGGESGPGHRPANLDWIRSVRDQCKAAGVPCFIKQLGSSCIRGANDPVFTYRDSKGGDPSEWPEDLRIREMPA